MPKIQFYREKSKFYVVCIKKAFVLDGLSVGSSTPARGPQDGPNVHHGLSLMSQSLIFCICPGFTDETIFVLHVFDFKIVCSY
jgi:hypothetical protein